MTAYTDMGEQQLREEHDLIVKRYEDFKSRGLKLNMTRGKPATEQLDLSDEMLDLLPSSERPLDSTGEDARNYGILLGIPEARDLMGQIMGVPAEEVYAAGNSSLTLMFDTVARSMLFGVQGHTPWSKLDKVKWVCPAPGYDRHFAITQCMGIEMITVGMGPEGPDMDAVSRLVEDDPDVKGIWCVPKYGNPLGITYSDEVVRRFAQLEPAAPDFRIYWDNAYAVHDLVEPGDTLLNLREACLEEGRPDLYYMFASTSKITFAGSGISALATSPENLADIEHYLSFQTIGPDKVNQLRHVRYLRNLDGVKAQMRRQAAIIAPKFKVVLDAMERELEGLGIAQWTKPHGGYFISFDGLAGTAHRIVSLARDAGVALTAAGSTYPYGKDPQNQNLRIAPTYPSLEELTLASELFCICVRLAALEKLLG